MFILTSLVTLLISSSVVEPLSIIKGSTHLPICEAEQSCSYYSAPYTFSLCLCPETHKCPTDPAYSAVQDGTTYRFCQPRELPICKSDEYATTVVGILTSVHCLCEEGLSLIKGFDDGLGTAQFFCGIPEYCQAGGYCGSLEDEDYITEECPCPPGTACTLDAPLFWMFHRKSASCMPF